MDTELLFYYTNAKTLLLILENFKIKMSVLSKSSDLVERNYHMHLINPDKGKGKQESQIEADNNKYICFCTEPNKTNWEHKNTGYRLPNMWDMYADRHRGACIIIDKKEFIDENKTLELEEVEIKYTDVINEEWDLDTKMKYKLNSYRNENEIRFISKTAEEYCSIKNSVKNIILGVDFENTIVTPEPTEKQTYKHLLFKKIQGNENNINPNLFLKPLIDKNGKMIISENGCLLWKEMKENGIDFNKQ